MQFAPLNNSKVKNLMIKYKNIATFLVISFFLLVPFAMIKTLGGDYEIFPAAIFPGGADRIHIGDSIVEKDLDFYGKSIETDQWAELNKRLLLKKIYIHHIVYIVNDRYFGALSYEGFPQDPDPKLNPYSSATPEDIAQTKAWLRSRLLEQNCTDSVLLVRFKEVKIDKSTRELIADTIVNERILKLY